MSKMFQYNYYHHQINLFYFVITQTIKFTMLVCLLYTLKKEKTAVTQTHQIMTKYTDTYIQLVRNLENSESTD